MVSSASEGRIDVSKKNVAIEGGKLWHEYRNHNDADKERGKHQLTMTTADMEEAVMAIYSPDVVESISQQKKIRLKRKALRMQKNPDGHYVVVEVVGGSRNPNVIPAMILKFDEQKWNKAIESGLTLGEILYENDAEYRAKLDIEFNKKNRVTAAQFASKEAIANTPRSPRYDISVPQSSEKSNTSDEKNSPETNTMVLRHKEDGAVTASAVTEGRRDALPEDFNASEVVDRGLPVRGINKEKEQGWRIPFPLFYLFHRVLVG
ncbi:MAG: hypothetical protein J6W28_08240 [Clostridia bacterium]|nr:hypothetical protein [Clostridia bacterium]